MKRIRIGMMILMILLSTMACVWAQGQKEESSVTEVVFWNGYTGPDRPAVEQIVATFNESHDDIQIKMEIMPWDSLYQKLMSALVAGNGPDIIGYSISRVPEYADAGRLQKLDDYLASSSEISKDNLVAGLLDGASFEGSIYGVPMGFASMVMYYNKDHFRQAGLDPENPPADYAELEEVWKALLQKNASGVEVYPQAFGVKATVPMLPVILWAYGADIVTADGMSGLNTPEALAAMEFVQKAFANDTVSPLGLTGQEADNLFAAGKASIEWNGPWAINGFRGAGIDLGIAKLPAGPIGPMTWCGDTVIVMNADSKAKDEAWKFMEYWNSTEMQTYWASTVAFPPTRTDLDATTGELATNEDLKFFIESAAFAKTYLSGQIKASQIEEEVLTPLFEEVTRSLKTPRQALTDAHARLAEILAD